MSERGRGGLVAFLGPSLAADDARRLCPDVALLPPICQGDLSTVVERRRPRGILIVDGEFGQSLSVWHKEILHALHLGIRVIGASSMGALRAAELDRFGMEGVGEIYRYFRDGWLTADADVALLYGDPESGYRPLTWPLVNARATIAALAADGTLTADEAAAATAAAETVHFRQRTARAIAAHLRESGIDADRARAIGELLRARYVDQKAADAADGFTRLARLDEIPPPEREEPRFRAGRGFEPLLWSDIELERPTGTLRRYHLVNDVTLHHPDVEGLLERAIDRYVILHAATDAGVVVTADDIAAQRTRTMRRLGLTEDDLEDWLIGNDLDAERFNAMIEHEATCTRMRRWVLDTRLYERARRLVIEQLQLDGSYARAADDAARRRTLAASRPSVPYPTDEAMLRELLARQIATSPWRPTSDLATVADEHGFDNVSTLLIALADTATANLELHERRRRITRLLGLEAPSAGSDGVGHAPPTAPAAPTPPPPATAAGPPIAVPTVPGAATSVAVRVHGMLEAHQVTHVLLTAVELGLPGALANGPHSTDELAVATSAQPDRLERLLRALQAAQIVRRNGEAWSLTPSGRTLVPSAPGEAESLAAYADHVRTGIFGAWAGLARIIRGDEPPDYPDDEGAERMIAAATGALNLRDAVVDAIDWPERGRIADIGGGIGDTAEALARARPDLDVVLVELPDTAARAAARLEALDDGVTVTVVARDDEAALDPPVDRCVLTRVLVTLDDDRAIDMLSYARRSLRPGGRIDVIDLEHDGSPSAAFGDLFNLGRSGGEVRSRDAWQRLAGAAGLRIVGRRALTGPFAHMRLLPQRATATSGHAGPVEVQP